MAGENPNAEKAAADQKAADERAATARAAATATADKATADKVDREKAAASKAASVEGAKSVADAVAKVAAAAVAEIQKIEPGKQQDLSASGNAGGAFEARGNGFGSSGTVTLNGQQLETLEWSTTYIRGKVPAGAVSGELVVHVDDKVSRKGTLTI